MVAVHSRLHHPRPAVRRHDSDEWDASLDAVLAKGFMLGTAYVDFKGRGAFPDKAVFWIYSGYRY